MKIEPKMSAEQKPPVVDDPLRKVSRDFEAIFVHQMVDAMRKTVGGGEGFIPQSHAERVYRSMLDQEYSASVAQSDQLGLSDMIYRHLLQIHSGG